MRSACFSITMILLLGIYGVQDLSAQDTIKTVSLEEITVQAFGHDRLLRQVAAPISHIGSAQINRFGPQSILMAVNSQPGLRMEERSPGSYRFSIRASSLRAPFGVRNIKVYWNNIPVTDPGGQTYLNQFGYYQFKNIEAIKGPASSLYGAGTGGVLLINSTNSDTSNSLLAEQAFGTNGLNNFYFAANLHSDDWRQSWDFQQQESDGYRDHSALKRQVFSWVAATNRSVKNSWQASFLYGNLQYETPGGLTSAEYEANPRSARPGNGNFPGAAQAKAAIYQKQFIAGISNNYQWHPRLKQQTTLYGMFTQLRNPAIQNFGENDEPHTGGRTMLTYHSSISSFKLDLDLGSEIQAGFANIKVYKNAGGNADSLRTLDRVRNTQAIVFSQATAETAQWILTLSGSLHFYDVKFQRFAPATGGQQKIRFQNQFSPRVSIMRKGLVNVYAAVSKGFSPPSTAEFFPSGNAINIDLVAEKGINYEAGFKGKLLQRLSFDVSAFLFQLRNTIVQRRTAGGGDYYINAGSTRQYGIETGIQYELRQFFNKPSTIWLSHTWHDFHYRRFTQLANDFSGNRLPGEAAHALSFGAELHFPHNLDVSAHYLYSSALPLNDANTVYARSYQLVGIRLSYEKNWKPAGIKFSAGADNLLNEKYSLGNDLNAFGGRYFNAAPLRNFYIGLAVFLKRPYKPK
jgi:iron complex outermembrane receptor protein